MTDCGADVGLGHVMRCYALAACARQAGYAVTLASRDPAAPALERWQQSGCAVIGFASAAPGAATALVALAQNLQAAALVIDRYDLAADFFTRLAPSAIPVLVLDDLAQIDPGCALVINPNPGADARFSGHYARARRKLLGSDFALIRPEIIAAAGLGGQGVLVTLGGSDQDGLAYAVASALAKRLPDQLIQVAAAGPAPAGLAKTIRWHSAADLAPLLAGCDLVVCGGGVTAVEAACLGRPALLIILAENQGPGAQALAQAGAARIIATPQAAAVQVAALLADLPALAQMSKSGPALIDGHGARRVLAVLETIGFAPDPTQTPPPPF